MNYLDSKHSYQSFQSLKPDIIEILERYLHSRINSKHTCRKRSFDLDRFLYAIYQLLDNGDKSVWLKKRDTQIAGSYKRYLRYLKASDAINIASKRCLSGRDTAFKLYADTFTVKSIDGGERVGLPSETARENGRYPW